MPRFLLVRYGVFLSIVLCVGVVRGQGLLERLEKRLEGVIGGEERPTPPVVVESGYLGLTGDDDEAGRGVLVLGVKPGGPADTAGIQKGDTIVGVGDAVVTKLEDLQAQLEGKVAGSKLDFKINRGGKAEVVLITLGRAPAAALPPPRPEPPAGFTPDAELFPAPPRASLGVTVLTVTDEARRRYGLSVRQGALISAIKAGGPADRAGLPVGGVVVASDGHRIDKPDDLINIVMAKRPGEELLLSYYQGGTLFRKSVKLAESPAEARVVSGEDPRPATDRPLLKRLEKALEGVAGDRPAGDRPSGIPFAPPEASVDLRTEVVRLRSRVDALERRLAELEGKVPVKPAEEEAPPIKLNRPEPPPRPEPEVK